MKQTVIAALVILAAVAVATAIKRRQTSAATPTRRKALMTKREQAMYWRLRETFPNAIVLAQVAFSALITSEFKHRNRYNKKVADFVLCDPSFSVKAVIELDDASHKGREHHDAERERLLSSAGYTTLRFANVPDASDLRARIPITAPTPEPPAPKTRIAPPVAKSP
jgi:very-short-patch-repair endonuclease